MTDSLPGVRYVQVEIVGNDGSTHGLTLQASSLYDAAAKAIEAMVEILVVRSISGGDGASWGKGVARGGRGIVMEWKGLGAGLFSLAVQKKSVPARVVWWDDEQDLLGLLNDKPKDAYRCISEYLGAADTLLLFIAISDELDEDFRIRCGHRKPSLTATGRWDEQKQMSCVDIKISMPGLEAKRLQVWLRDQPRIGKLQYRSHRHASPKDRAKKFALRRICEELVDVILCPVEP
jgi:hypothetical protein